jgi:hypothetical protein
MGKTAMPHIQLHTLSSCAGGMQAAGEPATDASWIEHPHPHLHALMKLRALSAVSIVAGLLFGMQRYQLTAGTYTMPGVITMPCSEQ